MAKEFDKNVLFLTLNLICLYGADKDFYFDNKKIKSAPVLFKDIKEANNYLLDIRNLIIPAHPGNLDIIEDMQRH